MGGEVVEGKSWPTGCRENPRSKPAMYPRTHEARVVGFGDRRKDRREQAKIHLHYFPAKAGQVDWEGVKT